MDVSITHIGGPTALVEISGWRILTDPTFDPAGRRYYHGRGTWSRKVVGPAMEAAELGEIDAVLLSHDHHGDNLDERGRAFLPRAGLVLTTLSGARRLGGNAQGLEPWARHVLEAPGRDDVEVIATPCRHGPPLSRPLVGDVIGFALRPAGGSDEVGSDEVLWISGDTVLYDGVRDVAERLNVDTAVLHLGNVRFGITGPVHYTMTAKEAIELCALTKPRTAIPIHYEGWSHFREGREEIERELAAAPQEIRDRFRWLPMGVPTKV